MADFPVIYSARDAMDFLEAEKIPFEVIDYTQAVTRCS